MTPELLNAVFSGAVLACGAVGGLIAATGRRTTLRARDYAAVRRRLEIAIGHIYRLREELHEHGIDAPPRPRGLDPDQDDADERERRST